MPNKNSKKKKNTENLVGGVTLPAPNPIRSGAHPPRIAEGVGSGAPKTVRSPFEDRVDTYYWKHNVNPLHAVVPRMRIDKDAKEQQSKLDPPLPGYVTKPGVPEFPFEGTLHGRPLSGEDLGTYAGPKFGSLPDEIKDAKVVGSDSWPYVEYEYDKGRSKKDAKKPGQELQSAPVYKPHKRRAYYRHLVEKFGQPLKQGDNEEAVRARRQELFLKAEPGQKMDRVSTSFDYTGNYFDILTRLIPPDVFAPKTESGKPNPNYNPDFHWIDLSNNEFKDAQIKGISKYEFEGKDLGGIPSKNPGDSHGDYMTTLKNKGILVLPKKYANDKGLARARRLRKVVQNLFKITIRMDNFSQLSELSRFQQSALEEYALQTRKMFYIVTFLKDQMKIIDTQEGDLSELINAMSEKTDQFERLLGKKQFYQYKKKTERLREDKVAIEKLTKFTTEAILRRFKKMGISVDDITDLDGAIPKESADMVRWDQFKNLFNDNADAIKELEGLKKEYIQAVHGRGERIHLLLKFPLPYQWNAKDGHYAKNTPTPIDEGGPAAGPPRQFEDLTQTQQDQIKIFLEGAFDSLTQYPIEEGYEMMSATNYQLGGNTNKRDNFISDQVSVLRDAFGKDGFLNEDQVAGGSEELNIKLGTNLTNSQQSILKKVLVEEAEDLDEKDVQFSLKGGAGSTPWGIGATPGKEQLDIGLKGIKIIPKDIATEGRNWIQLTVSRHAPDLLKVGDSIEITGLIDSDKDMTYIAKSDLKDRWSKSAGREGRWIGGWQLEKAEIKHMRAEDDDGIIEVDIDALGEDDGGAAFKPDQKKLAYSDAVLYKVPVASRPIIKGFKAGSELGGRPLTRIYFFGPEDGCPAMLDGPMQTHLKVGAEIVLNGLAVNETANDKEELYCLDGMTPQGGDPTNPSAFDWMQLGSGQLNGPLNGQKGKWGRPLVNGKIFKIVGTSYGDFSDGSRGRKFGYDQFQGSGERMQAFLKGREPIQSAGAVGLDPALMQSNEFKAAMGTNYDHGYSDGSQPGAFGHGDYDKIKAVESEKYYIDIDLDSSESNPWPANFKSQANPSGAPINGFNWPITFAHSINMFPAYVLDQMVATSSAITPNTLVRRSSKLPPITAIQGGMGVSANSVDPATGILDPSKKAPTPMFDYVEIYVLPPLKETGRPMGVLSAYQPTQKDELEIIIKLPDKHDPDESNKRNGIITQFQEKQLLTRLKQNLASRLTNAEESYNATEFNDIKHILTGMMKDPTWLQKMNIKQIGVTEGMKRNISGPNQEWRQAKAKQQSFDQTVFNAFETKDTPSLKGKLPLSSKKFVKAGLRKHKSSPAKDISEETLQTGLSEGVAAYSLLGDDVLGDEASPLNVQGTTGRGIFYRIKAAIPNFKNKSPSAIVDAFMAPGAAGDHLRADRTTLTIRGPFQSGGGTEYYGVGGGTGDYEWYTFEFSTKPTANNQTVAQFVRHMERPGAWREPETAFTLVHEGADGKLYKYSAVKIDVEVEKAYEEVDVYDASKADINVTLPKDGAVQVLITSLLERPYLKTEAQRRAAVAKWLENGGTPVESKTGAYIIQEVMAFKGFNVLSAPELGQSYARIVNIDTTVTPALFMTQFNHNFKAGDQIRIRGLYIKGTQDEFPAPFTEAGFINDIASNANITDGKWWTISGNAPHGGKVFTVEDPNSVGNPLDLKPIVDALESSGKSIDYTDANVIGKERFEQSAGSKKKSSKRKNKKYLKKNLKGENPFFFLTREKKHLGGADIPENHARIAIGLENSDDKEFGKYASSTRGIHSASHSMKGFANKFRRMARCENDPLGICDIAKPRSPGPGQPLTYKPETGVPKAYYKYISETGRKWWKDRTVKGDEAFKDIGEAVVERPPPTPQAIEQTVTFKQLNATSQSMTFAAGSKWSDLIDAYEKLKDDENWGPYIPLEKVFMTTINNYDTANIDLEDINTWEATDDRSYENKEVMYYDKKGYSRGAAGQINSGQGGTATFNIEDVKLSDLGFNSETGTIIWVAEPPSDARGCNSRLQTSLSRMSAWKIDLATIISGFVSKICVKYPADSKAKWSSKERKYISDELGDIKGGIDISKGSGLGKKIIDALKKLDSVGTNLPEAKNLIEWNLPGTVWSGPDGTPLTSDNAYTEKPKLLKTCWDVILKAKTDYIMNNIIKPIFEPITGILSPDNLDVATNKGDRYKYVLKNVYNALNGPPGKRMKSRVGDLSMREDLVMENNKMVGDKEWWDTFNLIPNALKQDDDFKDGKLPKLFEYMILDYLVRLPYMSSINTCFYTLYPLTGEDGQRCVMFSEIVSEINKYASTGKLGGVWSTTMANDKEDIGGSVRTYIKYRDHHLATYPYNIVTAVQPGIENRSIPFSGPQMTRWSKTNPYHGDIEDNPRGWDARKTYFESTGATVIHNSKYDDKPPAPPEAVKTTRFELVNYHPPTCVHVDVGKYPAATGIDTGLVPNQSILTGTVREAEGRQGQTHAALLDHFDKNQKLLEKRIECDLTYNPATGAAIVPGDDLTPIIDTNCSVDGVKEETIKFNKSACTQLVTPGGLTRYTRYYGPFADVFDEYSTNFDLYQRTKTIWDQLKMGYNITVFGFGFSGSGKTYTLLGADDEPNEGLTQQILKNLTGRGIQPGHCDVSDPEVSCEQIPSGTIGLRIREIVPSHTHARMTYYKLNNDGKAVASDSAAAPVYTKAGQKDGHPSYYSWGWKIDSNGVPVQKPKLVSYIAGGHGVEEGQVNSKITNKMSTEGGHAWNVGSTFSEIPWFDYVSDENLRERFRGRPAEDPQSKAIRTKSTLANGYVNDDVGMFYIGANDIDDCLQKITSYRVNTLRISATPNNPQSSRSHLFLEFNLSFGSDIDEIKAKLTICDMAGSEDTKAIKDSFYKQSAKTTKQNALTKPWAEPMSFNKSISNADEADWTKTFSFPPITAASPKKKTHTWSNLPGPTTTPNKLTGHFIPNGALNDKYQKRKGIVFPALPFIPWADKEGTMNISGFKANWSKFSSGRATGGDMKILYALSSGGGEGKKTNDDIYDVSNVKKKGFYNAWCQNGDGKASPLVLKTRAVFENATALIKNIQEPFAQMTFDTESLFMPGMVGSHHDAHSDSMYKFDPNYAAVMYSSPDFSFYPRKGASKPSNHVSPNGLKQWQFFGTINEKWEKSVSDEFQCEDNDVNKNNKGFLPFKQIGLNSTVQWGGATIQDFGPKWLTPKFSGTPENYTSKKKSGAEVNYDGGWNISSKAGIKKAGWGFIRDHNAHTFTSVKVPQMYKKGWVQFRKPVSSKVKFYFPTMGNSYCMSEKSLKNIGASLEDKTYIPAQGLGDIGLISVRGPAQKLLGIGNLNLVQQAEINKKKKDSDYVIRKGKKFPRVEDIMDVFKDPNDLKTIDAIIGSDSKLNDRYKHYLELALPSRMSTISSRTHAWWSPSNPVASGGGGPKKPKKDIQKKAAAKRDSPTGQKLIIHEDAATYKKHMKDDLDNNNLYHKKCDRWNDSILKQSQPCVDKSKIEGVLGLDGNKLDPSEAYAYELKKLEKEFKEVRNSRNDSEQEEHEQLLINTRKEGDTTKGAFNVNLEAWYRALWLKFSIVFKDPDGKQSDGGAVPSNIEDLVNYPSQKDSSNGLDKWPASDSAGKQDWENNYKKRINEEKWGYYENSVWNYVVDHSGFMDPGDDETVLATKTDNPNEVGEAGKGYWDNHFIDNRINMFKKDIVTLPWRLTPQGGSVQWTWDDIDIERTYHNAMDIWKQFYLKFLFGNDIFEEHFYDCLPGDIDKHPFKIAQKVRARCIVNSLEDAMSEIFEDMVATKLHVPESGINPPYPPHHPDYRPPLDGGLDMIQVASELKPRLVLPMFFDSGANSGILTKKSDHPGEPNVPYGPLWHKPLSMVSVDSFLSTNGLTSMLDLQPDIPDESITGRYASQTAATIGIIPEGSQKNVYFMKGGPSCLEDLNKTIIIFDQMCKKIEPMGGNELAMKKMWVHLRDTFVAYDYDNHNEHNPDRPQWSEDRIDDSHRYWYQCEPEPVKEELGAGASGVKQCAKSVAGAGWHKVINKVEDGKSTFLMAIQAPPSVPPPGESDTARALREAKYEKTKQSYLLSPFIFHMNWLNSKYVAGKEWSRYIESEEEELKTWYARTLAPININSGLRPTNENNITNENISFQLTPPDKWDRLAFPIGSGNQKLPLLQTLPTQNVEQSRVGNDQGLADKLNNKRRIQCFPSYVHSAISNFISNYISLIVLQGDGIVSTLDHLATYFRQNDLNPFGGSYPEGAGPVNRDRGDKIKAPDLTTLGPDFKLEPCVEIDGAGTGRTDIPKDVFESSKLVEDGKELLFKAPPNEVQDVMNESSAWKPDGTKDTTFKNAPQDGTSKGRLHNPFKLSNSKDQKSRAGWDPDDTITDPRDVNYPGMRGVRIHKRARDSGERFLMYKTLKDLSPDDSISKYIMLTCIMRGEETPSTQGKYCLAAYNTLEFAQKVASTADSCKCIDAKKLDGRTPETKSITSEIVCNSSGKCETVQEKALSGVAPDDSDRKKCFAAGGGKVRTQKRNKKMRINKRTKRN